jgi:hypothetical protein
MNETGANTQEEMKENEEQIKKKIIWQKKLLPNDNTMKYFLF